MSCDLCPNCGEYVYTPKSLCPKCKEQGVIEIIDAMAALAAMASGKSQPESGCIQRSRKEAQKKEEEMTNGNEPINPTPVPDVYVEIKDRDIATIEALHDLLLDTHGYSLNCITLKRARELTGKMYKAFELISEPSNKKQGNRQMKPKFKAWDGVKMRDLYSIVFDPFTGNPHQVLFSSLDRSDTSEMFSTDPRLKLLKLLELTGCVDKDGTEIYDGDILRGGLDDDCIVIVGWSDEDAHWEAVEQGEGYFKNKEWALFQLYDDHGKTDYKVVGNNHSHDVGELIKNKGDE